MGMTGLQIFKYMPAAKKAQHSNCKECGCPTCMAFSLKLAKQQIDINACPYVSDELKETFGHYSKHAQNTVEFCGLKIGGENVLYRHEKTFLNPVVLAVIVDCAKSDYEKKINTIGEFAVNILNEKIGIDLILLKNANNKILSQFANLRVMEYEKFAGLDIDIVEETDFGVTKDYLINTRTKAIKEKDATASWPVCLMMRNDDIYSQCARASYYICKYANMIVFTEFDADMFSTLLTLRQNIFTDPQKTLQVEAGLYEFNQPNKNSIIFMTTNFALTFFAVSGELEALDIPSYLIVIPAQGMSVLTAWSAETFSAEIVAKSLKELDIRAKVDTRKIIIPGLLADIKDELHAACPDFEFIEGTREASAIGSFVTKLNV